MKSEDEKELLLRRMLDNSVSRNRLQIALKIYDSYERYGYCKFSRIFHNSKIRKAYRVQKKIIRAIEEIVNKND